MEHSNHLKIISLMSSMVIVLSLASCTTTGGGVYVGWGSESEVDQPSYSHNVEKGGPPDHAPAHGYRAKYEYRYYPADRVYFDLHRQVYFYLKGDSWQVAVSLPREISLTVDDYVTIGMDTDKPYTEYEVHRRKYPPGQMKKKNGKWAK
jgi:hypothetical protein